MESIFSVCVAFSAETRKYHNLSFKVRHHTTTETYTGEGNEPLNLPGGLKENFPMCKSIEKFIETVAIATTDISCLPQQNPLPLKKITPILS